MGPYGSFDGGMGWSGWVAMGFALVIFWGLLITGIVLLVRSLGHRHELDAGPVVATPALTILNERFARGDIDADEYGRRRQVLDRA